MDLDDILNDALEEVTKDEEPSPRASATKAGSTKEDVKAALSTAAASTAKVQEENAQIAASAEPTGEDADIANLLKMFGTGSDFEKVLDEAFKDLDLNDLMSKLGLNEGAGAAGGPGGEEAEMERLMKMLSGGAEGGAGGAAPDPKLLEELASKLESSMGGDQMNKMFENMMKSVMSKDFMYEPIKAITEEYPKFLAKKGISAEDRSRYEAQYSAYSALRTMFEQDPENSDKIMQIMQDLERFGQPPEEISKILGGNGGPVPGGGMPNPNACPTQ